MAQASPSYGQYRTDKVKKALDTDGPTFINLLSPCRLGWGFPAEETLEIGKLAVEACVWPLYEVVNGEYRLTVKPAQKKSITDYLSKQARFRHLMRPENAELVESLQAGVDRKWSLLLKRCGLAISSLIRCCAWHQGRAIAMSLRKATQRAIPDAPQISRSYMHRPKALKAKR